MTGPYEYKPMPYVLAVNCPQCAGEALFEFAELVRIELRKDVPFFEASTQFEYRLMTSRTGGRWHGAIYYALLHGPPETAITNLPEGYKPAMWNHGTYMRVDMGVGHRSLGTDEGAVVCKTCALQARHTLAWPHDARFQIEYRGDVLWAFHRESAQDLRNYIASTGRNRDAFRWGHFLRYVPKEFLAAKARDAVVKRLDRLL